MMLLCAVVQRHTALAFSILAHIGTVISFAPSHIRSLYNKMVAPTVLQMGTLGHNDYSIYIYIYSSMLGSYTLKKYQLMQFYF
jgi:hypothetical protein